MNLFRKCVLALAAVLLLPSGLSAQNNEPADSLVRLVGADSLQSVEIGGVTYRKVFGRPARFLHNNTYLLCDTALWNVNTHVIDAVGNVKILQEQTVLSSDRLQYFIDEDLAKFRGELVQLTDKDHNTLRTKFLDYNTKDSVAVFKAGGAMRDKDGQIIESLNGTYDSKARTFEFVDDVNMFTDSVFVSTTYLKYESDSSLAIFGSNTNAWRDDNMLSADAGWYNRDKELFFFRRAVHVMSDTQEAWCDSLLFDRQTSNITMTGNAQVTDTTRNVSAVAGSMVYVDSLSRLTMTVDPAVVSQIEENNKKDTVWFGADSLVYFTLKKCDVPECETSRSEARLGSIAADPVTEFRRKAAEEAAKAAAEAAENDPNNPETAARNAAKAQAAAARESGSSSKKGRQQKESKESRPEHAGELGYGEDGMPDESFASVDNGGIPTREPTDSLALPAVDSLAVADSLSNAADSLETAAADTSKVGFVFAVGNVRMFRNTMQLRCDSLAYCDLDSLACLYVDPVIWNDGNHQYNSDSIYVLIKNQAMEKASLMSEAFIHIEEDTLHYDQIRGTEMTAYFDKEGQLDRFDALGNASALFFIEENNTLATVNKKESKMLSAYFKEGNIQRVHYYDTPKSDAYPVVQMDEGDKLLKGFRWNLESRPKGREDITTTVFRDPQRSWYNNVPHAEFVQTDKYFPGHMKDVYRSLEVKDSLKIVRERERKEAEVKGDFRDSLVNAPQPVDSLAAASDSLDTATDSLTTVSDSLAIEADSLAAVSDSLAVVSDSVAVVSDSIKTTSAVKPEVAEKASDFVSEIRDSLSVKADTLSQKDLEEARKALMKAQKDSLKAEKDSLRAEKLRLKQKETNAKWARLDSLDALKDAEKAARKLQKERENKRKALAAAKAQEAKDSAMISRYVEKYQKKKARLEKKGRPLPKKETAKQEDPDSKAGVGKTGVDKAGTGIKVEGGKSGVDKSGTGKAEVGKKLERKSVRKEKTERKSDGGPKAS